MKKSIITLSLTAWMLGGLTAPAADFDFADPKGVNTLSLFLDSKLEPIVGWAKGVTGKITFDPLVPDAVEGQLSVPTKNIGFAQDRMALKAMTAEWLNADKHPNITFAIKDINGVKEVDKETVEAELSGTFSLHGVEKALVVPVKIVVIEGGGNQRGAGKGDLMVLRSRFSIKRSDFGIKPEMGSDVVADEIQVLVAISGYAK